MTLDQFFNTYKGTYLDYDKKHGPQCKDLFSYYNRDVVKNPNYVWGDAWQLYEACPPAYYQKVSTPQKGDVAVWKKEFGGYGHVAIVWDQGLFFSQNYPLGTPCALRYIPTNKIQGYLRPINFTLMAKYESIRAAFIAKMTGKDKTGNPVDGAYPYIHKDENGKTHLNIIRKAGDQIIEKNDVSPNEFYQNMTIWF